MARLQFSGRRPADVAVLPVSGRPASLARALEQLVLLGAGMPDSARKRAEVSEKMGRFRTASSGALETLLTLHARRFCDGYYKAHDHLGYHEQHRMNVLITYAISLSGQMELLYNKTLALNNAGVSSIFERTLDSALSLLLHPRGFVRLGTNEFLSGYAAFHPLLAASLNSAGLGGHVLDPGAVFSATKAEARKRITEAIDKIDAEDEVP